MWLFCVFLMLFFIDYVVFVCDDFFVEVLFGFDFYDVDGVVLLLVGMMLCDLV